READQNRDEDREGDRPPELVHVALGVPRHEGDGQEDDHEGDRGGEDGECYLLGGDDRGGEGGDRLLLDVADDVLEHHDRVVDHDPHGEGEGEERHVVEGEAHHLEEGEGGDDRGGDGEGGDNDGADVADEEEHDE